MLIELFGQSVDKPILILVVVIPIRRTHPAKRRDEAIGLAVQLEGYRCQWGINSLHRRETSKAPPASG
ncbi:hypothetical protein [uncultured Bilophila sp.]|uniref:hypothetical protein n=1 Tax=uncultured Bilophila sp. TaxID=529385 RepID=UPI0025F06691|nr:hypothetical protein [uncultured Bilophila sp.]